MKRSGVPMIIREQNLKNLALVVVLVLKSILIKGLYRNSPSMLRTSDPEGLQAVFGCVPLG